MDAISLEQDINATPQFIGSLTELLWTQIRMAELSRTYFGLTNMP